MRLAAALAILSGTMTASPALAADDPWFGRDKALHFGASAVIAGGGYGGSALFSEDERVRLAVGGGLALGAGIAKELWDLSGRGNASLKDLTWDAAGTATGLLVAWGLDRLFFSRPPPRVDPMRARAPELLPSPFVFATPRAW